MKRWCVREVKEELMNVDALEFTTTALNTRVIAIACVHNHVCIHVTTVRERDASRKEEGERKKERQERVIEVLQDGLRRHTQFIG